MLSEILAHVEVHNNKCTKHWDSAFVNSEKHVQQCTVNVQHSPKEPINLLKSFFFYGLFTCEFVSLKLSFKWLIKVLFNNFLSL